MKCLLGFRVALGAKHDVKIYVSHRPLRTQSESGVIFMITFNRGPPLYKQGHGLVYQVPCTNTGENYCRGERPERTAFWVM